MIYTVNRNHLNKQTDNIPKVNFFKVRLTWKIYCRGIFLNISYDQIIFPMYPKLTYHSFNSKYKYNEDPSLFRTDKVHQIM